MTENNYGKTGQFLKTVKNLDDMIKQLYDERFLSGICPVDVGPGLYSSLYLRIMAKQLITELYNAQGELLGPEGGLTTTVEKRPGFNGKVGEAAIELLRAAYMLKEEVLKQLPGRLEAEITAYAGQMEQGTPEDVLTLRAELTESLCSLIEEELAKTDGKIKKEKLIDRKYLKDAYPKTCREMGADKGFDDIICLPEFQEFPRRDDPNRNDVAWDLSKCHLSFVKQMVWNLIEASFDDGCLKGRREVAE